MRNDNLQLSTLKRLEPKCFNQKLFTIIEYQGQHYVSGADVEKALGYKKQGKISELYNKYKDEFDPEMSIVLHNPLTSHEPNKINYSLDTPDSGVSEESSKINLLSKTRYYNRRGAYLLAIFSKVPAAKTFRKWVLDVLESQQTNLIQSGQLPTLQKKLSQELVFCHQHLQVVTIANEEWITSHALSQILGYQNVKSITCLFNRHRNQLDDPFLTRIVNLKSAKGNLYVARVFSRQGTIAVASLVKSELSEKFCEWLNFKQRLKQGLRSKVEIKEMIRYCWPRADYIF